METGMWINGQGGIKSQQHRSLCMCEHEIFLGGMRCFVFPVLTWGRGDSLFKWRISIGSSWIDLLAFFKCVLLDLQPGVLTVYFKRGICIETCPLRESLLKLCAMLSQETQVVIIWEYSLQDKQTIRKLCNMFFKGGERAENRKIPLALMFVT